MALITEDHLEQQALDQVILFQAADGQVSLDVRLEADTVWLSQAQMAELFGRERSVISKHIGNVFKEGELAQESTCAKFAQVQTEGTRAIQRQVDFYNLDVIISVGYRVKSPRGTQFRIWATQVLEGLMTRGMPSRGEMTDAAMAARAECVMLNKGPFLTQTIDQLRALLARMGDHQHKKTPQLRALKSWETHSAAAP